MLDKKLIDTPGTDEWFVVKLSEILGLKYPRLQILEQWVTNTVPTTVDPRHELAAQKIDAQRKARTHFSQTIVDSQLNRLNPLTFKTAASDDDAGDAEANRIWKINHMGLKMPEILGRMLTYGESYALVETKTVRGEESASIHSESPWQVVTLQDPQDTSRTWAALKIYRDKYDSEDVAVLYRFDDESGVVYQRALRFEGKTRLPAKEATGWKISGEWKWDEREELDTTEIPIVRFATLNGRGIFEDHLGHLGRINDGIYKREFVSASQAWRQRWVVKPAPPEVPADEEEVNPYESLEGDLADDVPAKPAAKILTDQEVNDLFADVIDVNPGSITIVPSGTKIEESGVTDYRQMIESTREDIKLLGEVTATQFTMAISEATNMSTSGADGIRERGDQVANRLLESVKPATELLMALAFEVEGDEERADIAALESIWKPVREISLKEKADSFATLRKAGLSKRTSMKIGLQFTPTEIVEEEQFAMNETFQKSLTAAPKQEVTADAGATDQSTSGQAGTATQSADSSTDPAGAGVLA